MCRTMVMIMMNDDGSDSSRSDVDGEEDDGNCGEFKEGKETMSPELFQSICKWLVEWGNSDSLCYYGTWSVVATTQQRSN
jgi:hypothetical protein